MSLYPPINLPFAKIRGIVFQFNSFFKFSTSVVYGYYSVLINQNQILYLFKYFLAMLQGPQNDVPYITMGFQLFMQLLRSFSRLVRDNARERARIYESIQIIKLQQTPQQYIIQSMRNSNQMQEQSSSDLNLTFKMGKSLGQKDQSINFLQLAKLHLKQYEDIDENEFEMIEQNENINSNSINSCLHNNSYLKLHTTVVPIGTIYQADIPDIMSSTSYLNRNRNSINRLKALKVHDPLTNQQFYNKYKNYFQAKFGNRTYQDIACIKKCMDQDGTNSTPEQYFSNEFIFKFWDDQFKNKDAELNKKQKKKKKKNKGSMGF